MHLNYILASDTPADHRAFHEAMATHTNRPRAVIDWWRLAHLGKGFAPSDLAKAGAALYQGIGGAHAVIVGMPGGRHAQTTLGVALGLARKVFVWAPTHADLGEEHCRFYHLGQVEDGPPMHPSDMQIVVGDVGVLAREVAEWWDVYSKAVVEKLGTCTGVTLHFERQGRPFTSAMRQPKSTLVLGQNYQRPHPEIEGDVITEGARHVIIVDKGKCPQVPTEHLNAALQLLGVAPVEGS